MVENHLQSRTHNGAALKWLAEGIIALTEPQLQCGTYSDGWEHYDDSTRAPLLVDLATWRVRGTPEQALGQGVVFLQSETERPHWYRCKTTPEMRLWFVHKFRRQFPVRKHAAASVEETPDTDAAPSRRQLGHNARELASAEAHSYNAGWIFHQGGPIHLHPLIAYQMPTRAAAVNYHFELSRLYTCHRRFHWASPNEARRRLRDLRADPQALPAPDLHYPTKAIAAAMRQQYQSECHYVHRLDLALN